MELSESPSHSLGNSFGDHPIGNRARLGKAKRGSSVSEPMLDASSSLGADTPRNMRQEAHQQLREEQAAALSDAYQSDELLENVELRVADTEAIAERRRLRQMTSRQQRAARGLRRRMSIEEMLTKNTWQKWIQFGRFPAKMVLHVLLLITQSAQIIFLTKQMSYFHRFSTRTFEHFFMPDDCLSADNAPYPIGGFKDCYLFTQEDTVAQIITAIKAVEDIQCVPFCVSFCFGRARSQQRCQSIHPHV